MRCVTPEALAYACCQVRNYDLVHTSFANIVKIYVNLSTLEQWSTMDSYFDVEKFYKIIIGLFKEPHSRWAKDTLEFLTTCVFFMFVYFINPLFLKQRTSRVKA
jgi:hypothetical protein